MNTNVYKDLLDETNKGKKSVIITKLCSEGFKNTVPHNKTLLTENSLNSEYGKTDLNKTVYMAAQNALDSGNLQFVEVSEEEAYLVEPFFPEPHLIILGGGHIAKPLAEFGHKAGFLVTVIDDRPSFANKERFPDAEEVICESFDKCFNVLNINESSFVVIVTRGHRHDMDCLRQVLKYDTAYTGMIGSRRRIKSVMEQMVSEGYSKEKIDRVNAPIGLDIGAVTPEEIAFSIISQVISFRRLYDRSINRKRNDKVNWPEFDRDVLEELSKEEASPKAIVTIVATKGSVPRKAGAKMIVWPFGRLLGSIGGGCSEGAVINSARDIIRSKGYMKQRIDMTADIAEEEGMVCGGIMDVVIEYSE